MQSKNEDESKNLENLKNASDYLKNSVLDSLVYLASQRPEQIPSDYKSFISLLHSFGINIRYIGLVYQKVVEKNA
jgi:hypothetical protein